MHIVEAAHATDPPPDQVAEYDEIQRHRNSRRNDGLNPDPYDADDLLANEGLESNPVECQVHHFVALRRRGDGRAVVLLFLVDDSHE